MCLERKFQAVFLEVTLQHVRCPTRLRRTIVHGAWHTGVSVKCIRLGLGVRVRQEEGRILESAMSRAVGGTRTLG